jgi:peptidyl-prolyl cis-trans isomerase B (cyclophilin B)
MSRRTRNRQLARIAARRQMERHQRQRRRQVVIAAIVAVALLGGLGASAAVFLGDDTGTSASPSPSASPTASPTADAEPGTQTGTIDPEPGPEVVACGAPMPAGALRPKPQFSAPADVLEQGAAYTATFRTSCGDIVLELLAERAPETVNSFVFLAKEGYFDATRIHRLDESIDVIQGGDPTGTGTGGPGYTIPDELEGGETYPPGTLAMANSGAPDSGGSQFFLIAGADGHGLDANPAYTVFGRVTEGLDVAERILSLPIQDPAAGIAGQQPAEAVYIEKVMISAEG